MNSSWSATKKAMEIKDSYEDEVSVAADVLSQQMTVLTESLESGSIIEEAAKAGYEDRLSLIYAKFMKLRESMVSQAFGHLCTLDNSDTYSNDNLMQMARDITDEFIDSSCKKIALTIQETDAFLTCKTCKRKFGGVTNFFDQIASVKQKPCDDCGEPKS